MRPVPKRLLNHESLARSTRSLNRLWLSSSRCHATTSDASSSSSSSSTDVLIVGGGAVGCALARQLALRLPCLSVGLVEAGPGPSPSPKKNASKISVSAEKALLPPPPHPRSYALSPASLEILGLDDPSTSDRLGYYDSMQIWEASQPSTLVFDKKDVALDYLGAVVEDSVILDHLWKSIIKEADVNVNHTKCQVWTNTRVSKLNTLSASSLVEVELVRQEGDNKDSSSTTTVSHHHQTRLLVAADGANSQIRKMASIGHSVTDYGQTALTFTVQVDRPLAGRCFQRFLPSGPLALLPTFSSHHAIVVWSTTPEQVAHWKDTNPEEGLIDYLNEQMQHGPEPLDPLFPSAKSFPPPLTHLLYGLEKLVETLPHAAAMATLEQAPFVAPPRLVAIASPRFAFPLSMRHASSYVGPRLALVGDAAHTVHPMAGQGLNLGLQDVAGLVQVMETAVHAGMDPSVFLQDYESSRRLQVTATLAGLHALQQVFGVQHVAAKYLKALGMNAVQTATPLRQLLVQAACLGVSAPCFGSPGFN